jgi:K+-transporting ATPase A subunit
MGRKAIAILATIVASFMLAIVIARTPALWAFIPAWLDDGVSKLIRVDSQETSSVAEFLAAWIFSLALLGTVIFAILIGRKWRAGKQFSVRRA